MDTKFRKEIEQLHGKCWDTNELQRDFEVISFSAPFVTVVRKSDKVPGTMFFNHSPRFYTNFIPDTDYKKKL